MPAVIDLLILVYPYSTCIPPLVQPWNAAFRIQIPSILHKLFLSRSLRVPRILMRSRPRTAQHSFTANSCSNASIADAYAAVDTALLKTFQIMASTGLREE
jgi:hypothetical protein